MGTQGSAVEVSKPTLSEKMLATIEARPITPDDLRVASLFVLDALAATLGARNSPASAAVLDHVHDEPITTSRWAFLLGALSNVLEMDAMHRASSTHPGTVVVPAAAAVAIGSKSGDGVAFLRAVLIGTEVAARIGEAAGAEHPRRYQATSTCGAFGAATAAGTLLGLTPSQHVHALGNAGTQAGGLWEFLSDGAMTKQWHAGRSAEAGVVAAQLASRGFTGPSHILEGDRGFFKLLCPGAVPDAVLQPRDEWSLRQVSYKPWPSPRHTHPAIDAALGAAGQINGDIERVELDTYPVALELCNEPEPSSAHAARFSLRYCVAAALSDRRVDFESFEADARRRHAGLASRVTVSSTERFKSNFPNAWGAEVRVYFSDGTVIRCVRDHAKGDPAAPMTPEEIRAKAADLLARGGVADPARITEAILGMADGGSFPAHAVSVCLSPQGARRSVARISSY